MRRALGIAYVAAFFSIAWSCARAADVSTFAGSGGAGIADGRGNLASFLMPEGLALAPNGDVYVADTAAQRVRRISSSAEVATVAGSGGVDSTGTWVEGGFANGPALSARFNEPTAVAVAADGSVVVADSGNHCLRKIAGGSVTTFAGQCGEAGNRDGTLASARFQRPLALAYDSRGTLYVADFGVGIKRISQDAVTTVAAPAPADKMLAQATGISPYDAGSQPLVYVATRDGMLLLDAGDFKTVRYFKAGVWEDDPTTAYVAGGRTFGYPYAVAAVDDYKFVYTDIVSNAVRFLTGSGENVAAGLPVENAGFEAGDFRDGKNGGARVDQPMGLARRADGSFVFSDTANRRIRILSNVDFRYQTSPADLSSDTGDYRIVLVGDSTVSSNQTWDQSISGILEKALRANWRALGFPKPPRVYPRQVIAGIEGTRDFVDEYLTSGLADMVILQLDAAQVSTSLKQPLTQSVEPEAAQWQPLLTGALRSLSAAMAKNKIPFVVALAPAPFEVAPAETGWGNVFDVTGYGNPPGPPSEYAQVGEMLRESAESAGVPVISAFPAFRREEMQPVHPALFGARDPHLSVQGVALFAQLLLDDLLRSRPWRAR